MTWRFYNFLIILLLSSVQSYGLANPLSIGVLIDGTYGERTLEHLQNQLNHEFTQVLSNDINIHTFRSANWDIEQAKRHYQALEKNSDYIILQGPISVKAALDFAQTNIPTIALDIYNAKSQNLPLTQIRTSGRANFSYFWNVENIEAYMQTLYDVKPFKHMVVLYEERSAHVFDEHFYRKKMTELGQRFQARFTPIPMDFNRVSEALQKIPTTADVIYLPFHAPEKNIKQITAWLIKHKRFSFTNNKRNVHLGATLGYSGSTDVLRLFRRAALRIDAHLSGDRLADMPVIIESDPELYFNNATARAIGFDPSFDLLLSANLINLASQDIPTYSLTSLLMLLPDSNTNLKNIQLDLSASKHQQTVINSQYKPSLSLSLSGTQLNQERAIAGNAERTLTTGMNIGQLIYSESINVSSDLQALSVTEQQYLLEQERLAQVANIFTAYLNILKAETNVALSAESLQVNRKNLEVAKLRASVGSASQADVYRWSSQKAQAYQAWIESYSQLINTKLTLNRHLGFRLGEAFNIDDIQLEDSLYKDYQNSFIAQQIKSPASLRLLIDFLLEEIKQHPTRKRLQVQVAQAKRNYLSTERTYYPSVQASIQYDHILDRAGQGSEVNIDSNSWSLQLSASQNLYEGGLKNALQDQRMVAIKKAELALQTFDFDVKERFEAQMTRLFNATTSIEYSKKAADNTFKNYAIVEENYKNGQVNITALIDSQDAYLHTKLSYKLSIYQYLIEFITLEEQLGFFHAEATPELAKQLATAFNQFKQSKQP